MRMIRCDCGFEASGHADDELVTQAQHHARDAHGMDLPADLVLTLARVPRPDTTQLRDALDSHTGA